MAVCAWCDAEMTTARSCTLDALHVGGRRIEMVRFGDEPDDDGRGGRCGDCGVSRGGWHHPGCDLQCCPVCDGQMLSCDCMFDEEGAAGWGDEPEPYGVDANGAPTSSMWVGERRVVIHHVDIPDSDVTAVRGIPCTTALRTVIDMAAELDRLELMGIVSSCLDRGLFTIEEAWRRLAEPDMQSYRGAEALRRVLPPC